jgi:hypothetical protein
VLRLATDDEVQAVALARHGRAFDLEPPRSYRFTELSHSAADDEVYVVSQAFVEFTDGGAPQRWASYEHHGHAVSVRRDVTVELLNLAGETAEDLVELLADMRIGGLDVSRWRLMSAPRRVELAPGLEARLAPLRRG